MYIYKNLERYFNPCINCGECCKIPGVFLPEQISTISAHMKIDTEELFKKFLIAEICSLNDTMTPVFVLSPVKVDEKGERYPLHFMDTNYINVRDKFCIFRDNQNKMCTIHENKPFACALLICEKMTADKSLSLEKSFYFHKWKNQQDIIYSVFPELKDVCDRLEHSVKSIADSYKSRNDIINKEISMIINGRPIEGTNIFR